MNSNPFIRPLDDYKRDINILSDYFHQASIYLSRQANISIGEAQTYIKQQLAPGGRFAFKDPKVQYLERNQYGDRELKTGTLSAYIQESLNADEPIAATFTTYLPVKKAKSILAEYIEVNAKIRKKMKAEMIEAKARGQKQLADLRNVAQKYAKQKNNSLSGTAASTSTCFLNQTAHSTLTSTTRSASSYANANNERFLTGTRHYWSVHIVLAAMTAAIGRCDAEATYQVIEQFGLYVPTAQDVVDVVEWSSRFYWPNSPKMALVRQLAERMTDAERVMFVYTGDFYHLKHYNPELIRHFLDGLIAIPEIEVEDPVVIFKGASGPIKILANQVCTQYTLGLMMREIPDHPDVVLQVARSICSIGGTIDTYATLINHFMTTTLLPGSIANFTSAVRRTVMMSDTDSTIFTVEKWTEWFTGDHRVTPLRRQVRAAMVFMVESTTQHILSTMACNMGISKDLIDTIEMKNEYTFEVFAGTTSKKHYYCLKTVLEGEQLKEPDMEIKGVGLVSSTVPRPIMKQIKGIMENILMTLHRGEDLSLRSLINDAAKIEYQLKRDISSGSTDYFRLVKVKTKETYKQGEANANYQQHLFWNTTLAAKYGDAPPLPYSSVKVSLDLRNKTQVSEWADSFTDVIMRSEVKKWMTEKKKSSFNVLHIPMSVIGSKGIPEEVQKVINVDKMIYDMMSPAYMAFQALGIHLTQSKMFHHVYPEETLLEPMAEAA